VDRQRQRWVKLMYGEDIGNTALYDLTINLRAISLGTACAAIAELASQPDYTITEGVRAQLEAFAVTCRRRLEPLLEARG
jgi:hypothetical protein